MLKKEIIRKIKLEKPKYFEANRFFGQKMSDFKKVNGMDFIYAESKWENKVMGYSYCGFVGEKFISGGIHISELNFDNNLFDLIKKEIKSEVERMEQNGMD